MIYFSEFYLRRCGARKRTKSQALMHCARSLPPLIRWGERIGHFCTLKIPFKPRAVWGFLGLGVYVQCMCGCMCNVCAENHA